MQRRTRTRGLGAVLFTDIVGSTLIAAEMGDQRWSELLRRHHRIVRGMVKRFGGRENDTAGDGFFVTFERPADAIRCAVEAASAVQELGIEIRAGVSFGELEIVDGKAGGLIVNTAARVMSVGGPGEVLVPASVRDIVPGAGIAFADHGVHRLKGLEDEMRLFLVTAVSGEPVARPLGVEEAAGRRREIVPATRNRTGGIVIGAIVAAALAAAAIAWQAASDEPTVEAARLQLLVELDPDDGRELQRIDLGLPRRPGFTSPFDRSVAAGQGGVWVLADSRSGPVLVHVDPEHGEAKDPVPFDFSFSFSMTVSFDAVWVATAASLVRVNPATDQHHEVARIPKAGEGSATTDLASDEDHLWLGRSDGVLMRIDRSGRSDATDSVGDRIDLVAAGEGGVWVVDQVAGVVTRVDPSTLGEVEDVTINGTVGRIAVAGDYLWVLDLSTGVVTRISVLEDRPVGHQVTVGRSTDMAVGFGAVWVSHRDGWIARVDATTLEHDPAFARVSGGASAIAVDPERGSIWVDVGFVRAG